MIDFQHIDDTSLLYSLRAAFLNNLVWQYQDEIFTNNSTILQIARQLVEVCEKIKEMENESL